MHRNVEQVVYIMKTSGFKDWIKSIEWMNRIQREKFREMLEGKSGVDMIIELIEQRQNDERICPYCQETEVYRWGEASELQRYRCRHCNRTFNLYWINGIVVTHHSDHIISRYWFLSACMGSARAPSNHDSKLACGSRSRF